MHWKRASLAEINIKLPTARSVGNKVACMHLTYLFKLKNLASSFHVPLIRLNDFARNCSLFSFQVFTFRAVLCLPDHKAYTSTVYRPHGCISSLGMMLKKLAARFAMSVPVREWFAMPRKWEACIVAEAWKVVKSVQNVLALLECNLVPRAFPSHFH